MIEMMISGETPDVSAIHLQTKNYAARLCEEQWKYYLCTKLSQLREVMDKKPELDMICMDITQNCGLDLIKKLRRLYGNAYILLIADAAISPMEYMRPSIKAEGLMLKPLDPGQIDRVLRESMEVFLERFVQNDTDQAFIIETRQGRRKIEYSRISYFESREKKLSLTTDGEEIVFYDTLDNLEQTLPPQFLRCHRSFMVNIHKVERISMTENLIYLNNGFTVPMSRSYRKTFKEMKL